VLLGEQFTEIREEMEEELYDDLEEVKKEDATENRTGYKEIFDDFADEDAKLPKDKVGEAIRCLGHNPLETEVSGWVADIPGNSISFKQFGQVITQAEATLPSTIEEVSESLGAFDLDGEGWIPVGQLKHLMCTDAGAPEECLSQEEFDFLLSGVKQEDGFIRYQEIAHLLTQP